MIRFAAIALVSMLLQSAQAQEFEGPKSYDAKFTFVRLRYAMSPDPDFGMSGRMMRDPPWHHDYPTAERNLMHIISEVTSVTPYRDGSRILDIGDPELMKYPVAYMSEPGFWQMNDKEADNLRNYLLKGGFLIFDDFGGGHLNNLVAQTQKLLPKARWMQITDEEPIFHVFFEINAETMGNVRSYRGQTVFLALFEDNDPKKRMYAIADYNGDIGEDWEFSETGLVPVEEENTAYRFGVNYLIYGLTH